MDSAYSTNPNRTTDMDYIGFVGLITYCIFIYYVVEIL